MNPFALAERAGGVAAICAAAVLGALTEKPGFVNATVAEGSTSFQDQMGPAEALI
jgi:hypothetical protein